MPFEITIPRLGWSMDEGTFVRWLRNDGDFVRAGEALFELEGEKAAQDIEALDSGVLHIPTNAPQPGAIVIVGAVVGYLLAEGEAAPVGATPSHTNHETGEPGGVSLRMPSTKSPGTDAARLTGIETPAITPRARRVARELNIECEKLTGSGRDGRIRERDVRRAANLSGSTSPVGGGVDRPQSGTSISISSRRRTIADRMMASRERTAAVTLTTRVDATNLVSLRNQFKTAGGERAIPSYSDIVMKLVALTLPRHPQLAARREGDAFTMPQMPLVLHLGFAVDTEEGLLVPVVRDVATFSLTELAERTQDLIGRARDGKLKAAEMEGGVFTITNLGAFGVDAFTPIINLPETAILGLGRIRREPVVEGDQIVARDQITLSLTFDHGLVDGAPAARFLQAVGQAIENPSAWLLRGD